MRSTRSTCVAAALAIIVSTFVLPFFPPSVNGVVPSPLTTYVILVQFSDYSATTLAQDIGTRIFTTLNGYIQEQSFGVATIQGQRTSSWVTLPNTRSHYKDLGFTGACANNLIQDAINAVDASVNFAAYKIVVVVFAGATADTCIPRGYSPEVTTMAFVTNDGVQVRRAALFAETSPLSVVAHEYTHTIGMADLYDAPGGGSPRYVGRWDPMSWPAGKGPADGYLQGLMAWTKLKLGWIPPEKTRIFNEIPTQEIITEIFQEAGFSSGYQLAIIRINSTSSYYVEYRETDVNFYDRNLPGRGVLISISRDDIFAQNMGTGNGPIRLVDAHPNSNPDIILDLDDTPFDIGPGQVSTFVDSRNDIRIRILIKNPLSYTIAVGKASSPIITATTTTTTSTTSSTTSPITTPATTTATTAIASTTQTAGAPRCMIATAAYGSELAAEVQFLRDFRDKLIMETFAGSNFMRLFNAWYYSFSPTIANHIASDENARSATRVALYPLIGILHISWLTYSVFGFERELGALTSGLVASSLIGLVYMCVPVLMFQRLAKLGGGTPSVRALARWLLVGPVSLTVGFVISELSLLPEAIMAVSGAIVLNALVIGNLVPALLISRVRRIRSRQ